MVLPDDGMSCFDVATILLLDEDTVRTWHRLYEDDGIEGLVSCRICPGTGGRQNLAYPVNAHTHYI